MPILGRFWGARQAFASAFPFEAAQTPSQQTFCEAESSFIDAGTLVLFSLLAFEKMVEPQWKRAIAKSHDRSVVLEGLCALVRHPGTGVVWSPMFSVQAAIRFDDRSVGLHHFLHKLTICGLLAREAFDSCV